MREESSLVRCPWGKQAGPLCFERQVTCAVNIRVVLRLVPPLTAQMVNVAAPGTFDWGKTIPLAFSVTLWTLVSFATLT